MNESGKTFRVTRCPRKGCEVERLIAGRVEAVLAEFEALDYRKRRAVSADALAERLRDVLKAKGGES